MDSGQVRCDELNGKRRRKIQNDPWALTMAETTTKKPQTSISGTAPTSFPWKLR